MKCETCLRLTWYVRKRSTRYVTLSVTAFYTALFILFHALGTLSSSSRSPFNGTQRNYEQATPTPSTRTNCSSVILLTPSIVLKLNISTSPSLDPTQVQGHLTRLLSPVPTTVRAFFVYTAKKRFPTHFLPASTRIEFRLTTLPLIGALTSRFLLFLIFCKQPKKKNSDPSEIRTPEPNIL